MPQDFPPESFVRRLRAGRVEEWELHRCHHPAGLCPLATGRDVEASGAGERRCLEIHTADVAQEWLRPCVTDPDEMMALRDVVEDGSAPLSRIDNRDVIERVADMVARGDLCIVQNVQIVYDSPVRPEAKAPARPAQTPRRPRVEEPILDDEAPNVPAALLVDAARAGTPFCEH